MHDFGIVPLDKVRLVAAAGVEGLQVSIAGASLRGRTRYLVAVEVQNRKDRTIPRGIKKVDRLPASLKWTGLGFPVTDDTGNNQVGIVEGRTKRVNQRVA